MKTEPTADRAGQRLHQHYTEWFTGDGAQTEFLLAHTLGRLEDVGVFVNGNRYRPDITGTAHDFKIRGHTPGYDGERNAIKFTVAPPLNNDICVEIIST